MGMCISCKYCYHPEGYHFCVHPSRIIFSNIDGTESRTECKVYNNNNECTLFELKSYIKIFRKCISLFKLEY